ncbi:MAG: ATP-binding protein, partial [Candidatus Omnitrophica bacterium]|nr:ATP-binding protein [Candidatus Omnitrophota bacterium]
MFIGREQEIALLNKIYNQGKAELILLYGRRRIGKTRLLKEFIK